MAWIDVSATATVTIGSGQASLVWTADGINSAAAAKEVQFSFASAPARMDLTQMVAQPIIPGSVMFTLNGVSYIDRNGQIYAVADDALFAATGSALQAGEIDYSNGEISLTWWRQNGGSPAISVQSCATTYGDFVACEFFFRTSGAPLRPASLTLRVSGEDGATITVTANESGLLVGPNIDGKVDQDTGVVRIRFGSMVSAAGNETKYWYDPLNVVSGQIWRPIFVIPATLVYNAVVLSNIPLNADILGLDPVRLPMDGRVPIFRSADVVVIHNTQNFPLPNPAVANATYDVGRVDLAALWLVDQVGKKVGTDEYVIDLDDGTVTMSELPVLDGLIQPLVATHRIEDLALLADVQINGQLTIAEPLSRDYGDDSYVSSALLFGDLVAQVTNVHDLQAWSAWSNSPTGSQAGSEYNTIDYPIEVKNNGAVTERWRISFTNMNSFQVIGENLGVIYSGTTTADVVPTNPLTGREYFAIRSAGWGAGWSAGNQLRFNTVAATKPIWVARTVLPGATLNGDSLSVQMRGDVDAE